MKSEIFSFCLLVLIAAVVLFISRCPPVPNTLPTITKASSPSGAISQNSSTFSWNGSDPDGTISKYEYRKDGDSWVRMARAQAIHGVDTLKACTHSKARLRTTKVLTRV
ncbi:hypothetical protein BG32_01665 [Mesotoga sp. HF07.pep.5.2.highcov]|jgi:uncharacterized lipoprotein YajG|uniref:Uncharacterized protein n=1 Tax=Mesotoga prima MesG1.Ag.4.2 TaxID=660470 RepID=I2F5W9_9BACT|nr:MULTISPECIES: hypothetical protein [Mesotoga]AFK07322.1 hypothetical protein Theba_1659 [Mesotoga prima MesG1.Ag.4.2]AFK07393.1 hypothetical protein Theba_1736 [Mesotoga prima MesG1.Ag.4.2]RLL91690.1 hypothetical protein BG32_01665 [Mesotoga sp. HF07.pep.5.2.highcov]